MRYLAFVLLAPTFAVLAWIYWAFPKALPRTRQRRLYDVVALAVTVVATLLALTYALDTAPVHENADGRWPQIAASLAAWHVFPVLIGVAWWVRGRTFRIS